MGSLTSGVQSAMGGLLFGAVMALSACRVTHVPQSLEVKAACYEKVHAVKARVSADGLQLGLHFVLKGRDAHALGNLTAAAAAALSFEENSRSIALRLGKSPHRVPVFGPEVWRAVAGTLALRLAPANPAQGTLILAGGRELIAHRVGSRGALTPLSQRPPRLKIIRQITAAALAKEVFTNRGDALDQPGGQSGPVVLLTGTFPELVYLDRAKRRLIFLTVPPEDAAGLPLNPLAGGSNLLRQAASLLWRSNILAVLKNPFSTGARFIASGESIVSAGVGRVLSRLPDGVPPPVAGGAEMDLKAWTAELSGLVSTPAVPAALRIRLGGDEFFPDFIQAVQEARQSVDVQLYIFDNDDYAVGLADLLRRRSNEGVRVRVLMDESASLVAAASPPASPMPADFTAPDDIGAYLESGSHVDVRRMAMAALSASHTKIVTVDQKVAWLGGMNFGREYRYDWHDLMIEVRGPLVERIREDFARTWARHGWAGDYATAWRNLTASPPRAAKSLNPPGTIPVQPLYTSAWKHEIAAAQIAALRRCQSRVWLENAYLSDDAFLTELVNARHRGVDVRVVFPAGNDNNIMAANNRALVPLLRRHGIRVYLLPGMSHVKAALYDGWACVGSANFDRLSLRVNNEFSIGCSDSAFTHELRHRLFETDFERSQEVTSQPRPGPSDELMNALIRSFAGQL